MTGPILLAYDGSPEAQQALARAGELLRGPALVVHVYSPPQSAPPAPSLGAGLTLPIEPVFLEDPAVIEELEDRARAGAARVAAEGVELARAAGFDAEAEIVMSDGVHGVWNALASLGDERQASVIVVGHRDVSWLAEAVRGSVAGDLVKHVGRPVLVIPAAPAD